jgi:tetratricopeptide (TPR) repeat protein
MAIDRIEKLKEFLLREPDDPFIKHALALEYWKAGDTSMARGLLEDILAKDSGAVGSYYQLGKLLEAIGEPRLALGWYEKGMAAAKTAGEKRAYNELRAAYDDLVEE